TGSARALNTAGSYYFLPNSVILTDASMNAANTSSVNLTLDSQRSGLALNQVVTSNLAGGSGAVSISTGNANGFTIGLVRTISPASNSGAIAITNSVGGINLTGDTLANASAASATAGSIAIVGRADVNAVNFNSSATGTATPGTEIIGSKTGNVS